MLEQLVGILDAANDGEPPPKLVRIELIDDDVQIGMKPLAEGSIADHLLGCVAPEEWVALGVMAGGWAGPMDGSHLRPSAHPEGQRIRSVVLVGRDGETAGVTRFADGRTIDGAPPEGAAMDCLRRAMGLPTPPPSEPPSRLFTSVWLAAIAGAARDRTPSWPAIMRLRPRLEDADECTWESLRQAAVEGRWPAPDLTASEAEWLDEGSFARWVLGAFPPLPVMLDELAKLLPPSTIRRLVRVVEELTLATSNPYVNAGER